MHTCAFRIKWAPKKSINAAKPKQREKEDGARGGGGWSLWILYLLIIPNTSLSLMSNILAAFPLKSLPRWGRLIVFLPLKRAVWIKDTASFPLNTDTAKTRSRATKQPSVGGSRILDLAYQRRGARSPGCGVSQGRNTQTYFAWFWLAGLFQSCLSSSIDRKMCFPLNKWSKFLNQCCWEGGWGGLRL